MPSFSINQSNPGTGFDLIDLTAALPTAIKDEGENWKMTGPAAVLVSKSSATHCQEWENGPQFICAIDRTHSEMVKFGPEDHEYEKVVEFIQSLVREARQAQQRRRSIPQISPEQIPPEKISPKKISPEKTQECLQSLAFEHMQTRASGVNDAILGTCEWLLQHETYIRWIASDRGLLWIKGKPGSGKSTLLKYAFSHQESLSSKTNSTTNSDLFLSFFFHGRGEELQKTPFGLFRSLLHQVLKQAPDALRDLVNTFVQKCNDMGNYQETWKWHPDDLWRFLASSLPRVLAIRSVWLFIDALDECGEVNAKDLVRKFELLIQRVTPLSTSSKQLRICFSCRHYPILSSPGLLEVCLERENRADISTYVRSELSFFGESIPITIPDLIIDRASGVFLWAELVVKHVADLGLNGDGPAKIVAAVHSIPKGLDELYDELIRNMTLASLKLIRWVCFARRPLSVSELRWAMAINADYSSLHACQNADDYVPDDNRMKNQIVKLSKGLAEITTGDHPIVQFIHQSVKDFFIEKGLSKLVEEIVGGSISPYAAIGMSHLELSKICIQYFAMEEIVQTIQFTSRKKRKLQAGFPFLSYAIHSWVAQLKKSDDYDIAPEGILELLDWPSDAILAIWKEIYDKIDEYSYHCPEEGALLEHLAARYGIRGVMNTILQSDRMTTIRLNSKDEVGTTPLLWAAEGGHEALVSLLLATKQVDINVMEDLDGQTPLSTAAYGGHVAVVKLLLSTGQAEINLKDHNSRTALSCAAYNGHVDTVKLLLDTGQAEIDSIDKFGKTALSLAAEHGHEAIVELLLARQKLDELPIALDAILSEEKNIMLNKESKEEVRS